MPSYLKKYLPLLVVLLAFIIAKIPTLNDPFFWDESWVYAPSIYRMYEHGPSLLPDAIPVAYSRGHPLLYQAACAAWMNVFGPSHVSMHCFALCIAIGLMVATYETMRRVFNERVGLMSLILLAIHTRFYTASSFLLTDVPIALFALLSIYYYSSRKYAFTSLFLTLLFFTKESAWVLGIVMGIDIFQAIVRRTADWKEILRRSIALAVPCLFILLFFIVQKQMMGWYVNPEHTSLINAGIENTLYNLSRTFNAIFFNERMYYRAILLALLVILTAIKLKAPRHLLVILALASLYAGIRFFSYKDAIFYVLVGAIIIGLCIFFLRSSISADPRQSKFIRLAVGFAALYTYFCCVNFWETRYLYPALFVLVVLMPAVLYEYYLNKLSLTSKFYYFLAGLVILGLASFTSDSDDLNQYTRMEIQQQVVDYFENNNFYDKPIYAGSLLEELHLEDWKTGFRHTQKQFTDVTEKIDSTRSLLIFDNIEYDPSYEAIKNDKAFFLLKRLEKGTVWAEIYKRK